MSSLLCVVGHQELRISFRWGQEQQNGRWFHWNLNFPTQWGMYALFNGAFKLPFYSVTCALCVAKFKMNWSVILCDLYQSFKPNAGLRFRSLRIVYFVATLCIFLCFIIFFHTECLTKRVQKRKRSKH